MRRRCGRSHRGAASSAVSVHVVVILIMIPVLKDVLPSPRARTLFLSVSCSRRSRGCGGSRSEGGRKGDGRRSLLPARLGAEQVAGAGHARRRPHAAGARAARRRALADDVEHVWDADLVLYLGGGFQPAVEEAVASARGRRSICSMISTCVPVGRGAEHADPHVWLDPVRFARHSCRDRSPVESRRPAAAHVAQLGALDDEVRAGLATCRPPRDRHDPRGVRLSRQRYGLRRSPSRAWLPRPSRARELEALVDEVAERCDDGVHRDARAPKLAETSRARPTRRRRPRSDRGADQRTRSPPARTTSPSCAATSRRCGRHSDVASGRA